MRNVLDVHHDRHDLLTILSNFCLIITGEDAESLDSIFSVLFCFSDGGGRSGVYLAIDANLELAEEEDCFDVFGFLKKLRQSRKGLIENEVRLRAYAKGVLLTR